MSAKGNSKSVLRQIAQLAEVSVSTASIVLNGRGDEMRISKATQQRVQECAKRMDYTPNIYARKLRKSAQGSGAKVVGVFWSTEFLNESMGEFFYSSNRTVAEHGYDIDYSIHFFTPGRLDEIRDQLNPWQFNGIIFCGSRPEDAAFLESLKLDIPIVLSNESTCEGMSSVSVDNVDVGRRSAQALKGRGYRRVGMITQARPSAGARARCFGFSSEAERLGMALRDEWCAAVPFSDFAATSARIEAILSAVERPDALFVASYDDALSIVIAVNNRMQRLGPDAGCALFICGQDAKLNVLAHSVAFVDLGIGNYAVSSVELIWLLMNGQLKPPVKWVTAPKIDVSKLRECPQDK